MTDEKKFQAFHLMADMGGGFASRLADAWFYADSTNREKIEAAFEGLIKRYATMAENYAPPQPD